MKHTTNVEVVTKVMRIESREVFEGDILLLVDKDSAVVPWYVRDAEFVWSEPPGHSHWWMVKITMADSDQNERVERYRDNEKVTVVRIK